MRMIMVFVPELSENYRAARREYRRVSEVTTDDIGG